jgi:hypothetical protein
MMPALFVIYLKFAFQDGLAPTLLIYEARYADVFSLFATIQRCFLDFDLIKCYTMLYTCSSKVFPDIPSPY